MKLVEITALVAVDDGYEACLVFDYAQDCGVTVLDYSERPMAIVAEPEAEPEPEAGPEKNPNHKGRSQKPGDDLLRRALAMRTEGKLYREIADALDVHQTTAWSYVQQAEAEARQDLEGGSPATFVMIPTEILTSGISPNAVAVAAALSALTDNKTGECVPTVQTIADRLGSEDKPAPHPNTVRRGIRELEDAGFIEVTHRRRTDNNGKGVPGPASTSNLYRLIWDASEPTGDEEVAS
jgi:hypothetical protein